MKKSVKKSAKVKPVEPMKPAELNHTVYSVLEAIPIADIFKYLENRFDFEIEYQNDVISAEKSYGRVHKENPIYLQKVTKECRALITQLKLVKKNILIAKKLYDKSGSK